MSFCRFASRSLWPVLLAFLVSVAAHAGESSPASLLSANSVLAVEFDGLERNREAFDRTALAEVLRGDLGPLATDLGRRMTNALGPDIVARRLLAGGPPDELTALQADAEQLPRVFEALRRHGFLLGVELAEGLIPAVHVTLVFPGGGSDEVRPALESAVHLATRLAEIKLNERKVGERTLQEGGFFGIGRLAYWQEGPHFVLTIGTMPPETTITLAEGKGSSLADEPKWKEVTSFEEYPSYARALLDTERLQRIVTRWVAPAKPILEQFGVDRLNRVAVHLGFEGPYQRITAVLATTGERRGVLKMLADGQSLDLEKLPALPPDASAVWTLSAEPEAAYRFGISTIEKIVSVVDPDQIDQFHRDLGEFETALGGEAWKSGLAALGPTVVAYNEPGGIIPFFSGAFSIQVRDSAALDRSLEAIVPALEQAKRDSFSVVRRPYRGTTLYVFQPKQQFVPFQPAFAVHEGWLHIAPSPQGVQGAIYRAGGGGRALTFTNELRQRIEARVGTHEAGEEPRKLVAFAQSDPRPSVRTLLSLLPLSRLLGAALQDSFFQDLDTTRFPHAQSICEPLSHNFSMLTSNEHSIRFDTYSTLPMPLDFGSFSLLGIAGF
jgi:hypothetical protein